MFWLQAAASFAAWIVYGVLLSRRSSSIRRRADGTPRVVRAIAGAGLMAASLLVLMLALLGLMSAGGFGSGPMPAWSWAAVTVLGVGFVHCQAMAAAMLVSLARPAVTAGVSQSSTNQNPQEGLS